MEMELIFKKAVMFIFMGLASVGTASASEYVVLLSCPKIETLNTILKKNPAGLYNFPDQGFNWAIKEAVPTNITGEFKSFSRATIPMAASSTNAISCEYHVQLTLNGTLYIVNKFEAQLNKRIFKGESGNWAFIQNGNVPLLECTAGQRADSCTFVKVSR